MRTQPSYTVTKRPDEEEIFVTDSHPVVYSGYLKKQAGSGVGYRRFHVSKTWLKRWYEIRGPNLIYYQQKRKVGDGVLPSGIINLLQIRSVSLEAYGSRPSSTNNTVLVLQSENTAYRFRAADSSPVAKWHEMLLARVAELQVPEFLATLRALYMAYNPQLMSSVPSLALRFRNRQGELVRTIHKKYSDPDGPIDDTMRSSIQEVEVVERNGSAPQLRAHRRSVTNRESYVHTYTVGDSVLARYRYRGKFRHATVVGADQSHDMLYDIRFEGDGSLQPKTLMSHMKPAPSFDHDAEMQNLGVKNPLGESHPDQSRGAGLAEVSEETGVETEYGVESDGVENLDDEGGQGEAEDDDDDSDVSENGDENNHMESVMEGIGEGFYTICTAKIFDTKTPVFRKYVWTSMAGILFLGQLVVSMSLIVDVVSPMCKTQDDCSNDYIGYACVGFHGATIAEITGPMCMECRAVLANYYLTCKEEYGPLYLKEGLDDTEIEARKYNARSGQWSTTFSHVARAVGMGNTTAPAYCLASGQYARGNTCHTYTNPLKTGMLSSRLMLAFVALMVGLSVMAEKLQATYVTMLLMATETGNFRDSEKRDNPRLRSPSGTIEFTRFHRFTIQISKVVNALRVRLLLPLVVTTVVALVGFQGSSSLDIALNGLATVFILEIDDVIGQTLFSGRSRERSKKVLEKEFLEVPKFEVEVKIDQFASQLSIILTLACCFTCLNEFPGDPCLSLIEIWMGVNYMILG
jgi:hypothetical protein